MVTNNSSNIVTAAAGKVLQGAGVGVAPTYSTPTYPSTSGTSRKILVSDGTNNVYSTETYAVPGTSGNVLTSDGTNWTSAAPAGAIILTATKSLTSAQVKALNGTPQQVIAAPGAGKVIQVISATTKMTYGGTNVFTAGASQIISLRYGTGATAALNALSNAQIVASANQVTVNPGSLWQTTAANLENQALNLWNPIATEITGNAANNNTVQTTVLYIIVTQ